MQLDESNDPAKDVENVTVPAGDVGLDALVSVTVAVQVEAWLTTTGVSQVTRVVVVRNGVVVTARLKEPELPEWFASAG